MEASKPSRKRNRIVLSVTQIKEQPDSDEESTQAVPSPSTETLSSDSSISCSLSPLESRYPELKLGTAFAKKRASRYLAFKPSEQPASGLLPSFAFKKHL